MGSYELPEDYDGPAPLRSLWCSAKWEGRPERHQHFGDNPKVLIAEIRACAEARLLEGYGIQVGPCGDLLEGRNEDGAYTYPCAAPMWNTAEGTWSCAYGHSHVDAQTRHGQGWDYADEDEADVLMRYGVRPMAMNGSRFLR
jgi:hypothetical protein